MSKLNFMDWIAIVLSVAGAVNWGLFGAFGFDLVTALFGSASVLSSIVYIVVGLGGLYLIATAVKVSKPM